MNMGCRIDQIGSGGLWEWEEEEEVESAVGLMRDG